MSILNVESPRRAGTGLVDPDQAPDTLRAVLDALGGAAEMAYEPRCRPGLIHVATPEDEFRPGTLMVGIGVCDPDQARVVIDRLGDVGDSAVILRQQLALDAGVIARALDRSVTVIGCDASLNWAEVIRRMSETLGKSEARRVTPVQRDLFQLADEAAALFDGPVTIEDSDSHLIAYSSTQDFTDAARLATITGRHVPLDLLSQYRSRGVLRKLLTAEEPFVVEAFAEQTMPRLVIPIRVAGVFVGAVWVVRSDERPESLSELGHHLVADVGHNLVRLRTLRLDVDRQLHDRLNAVLLGEPLDAPPSSDERWNRHLGEGPWRVVALGSSDARTAEDLRYGFLQASSRKGWSDPPCLAIGDHLFVVCHLRGTEPGSWEWLAKALEEHSGDGRALHAHAGRPCSHPSELSRSRAEAQELADIPARWRATGSATTFEDEWVSILLNRATDLDAFDTTESPVRRLWEHDQLHGTEFVRTLDMWLGHLGDIRRAADSLYVHPNTLRQRLKRIRTLVPVDLENPEQTLAIRLHAQALQRRGPHARAGAGTDPTPGEAHALGGTSAG